MKYIIILSYIFFTSEFILMLLKRSKKKTSKQRSDKGSLALLWVMITLCLTFGFVFSFANYHDWDMAKYVTVGIGALIILIGGLIRWLSILQLKKAFTVDVAIGDEQTIKTDGMYKSIRHPSYLGLYLIMIGFSICMYSFFSVLVIAIPMLLVLLYRIKVEENVLIDEFGEKYIAYKAKTKKMLPGIF